MTLNAVSLVWKAQKKNPTAVESLCNAAPVTPQTLVFDRQSQKYKERFFFFFANKLEELTKINLYRYNHNLQHRHLSVPSDVPAPNIFGWRLGRVEQRTKHTRNNLKTKMSAATTRTYSNCNTNTYKERSAAAAWNNQQIAKLRPHAEL